MQRRIAVLLLLLCLAAAATRAQPAELPAADTPAPASTRPIRDAAPVVVTGTLPGPGMWKVSKGDHVMYVLGTLSPLPKRMQWVSRDVEKVLAEAGEVLVGYGVELDADVGIFGRLALIPSLLRARRNPDGAELKDVLPPQSYATWQVLKRRYIGRDGGIEKWRPIFAATHLYEEAIEDRGMVRSGIVAPVIDRAIRRHDIKRTEPRVKIGIKEPKVALKEFRTERLGDLECFEKTLQNLETDLARMTERANAWAVGDLEALRRLPLGDQYQACLQALTQASVARKYGLGEIRAEIRQTWLAAAEAAIAANRVSLATLPLSDLLEDDGYLGELQARGYTVEPPERASAATPPQY